jgi:hypothetical protein
MVSRMCVMWLRLRTAWKSVMIGEKRMMLKTEPSEVL